MYTLRWAAYSGFSYTHSGGSEREDVRREAAGMIRDARRRGEPVTIISRGKEWEFETPDDAATIGDRDGLLYIQHRTFPCRECGSAYESPDEAGACCTEDPDQREEDEHIYQQELAQHLR